MKQPAAPSGRRRGVLGIEIDPISMSETVARITTQLESGRPGAHLGVNAANLIGARDDAAYTADLNAADLVTADGLSMVWAGRLLGVPIPERVTGIDLMQELLKVAPRREWNVYLLGAEPEVVASLAARLIAEGIAVTGHHHGYLTEGEVPSVVRRVKASGADLLFVGMPSPAKERLIIHDARPAGIGYSIGVGGSFDVLAGRVRRAPRLLQHIGLEWFFRLAQEPRRLAGRYLVTNTRFLLLLVATLGRRTINGARACRGGRETGCTVRPATRCKRVDILFGLGHHPDQRVRRISRTLASAGYEVRVLAWDRDLNLPVKEVDEGVRIVRARVRSRSGRGWSQLLYLARAVLQHLPRMRRDPPAVIHAVDLPMLAAALLCRPLLPGRQRIVFDAFEIYNVMESHKYPPWLLALVRLAERKLPPLADLVITPGAGRQAHFAAHGIDSLIVGNWIDPPAPAEDRSRARVAQGLRDDEFCVVYAGGLEPSREIDALIRHAERTPGHVVLIAGRGEQDAEVAEAAARLSNLRFLGWVPDPNQLYAAADAVFYALRPEHPYAQHPAPNNLYRAIAMTMPLVYREQGELATVSREAEIGIPFDDDASLDAALRQLEDPVVNARIREQLQSLQEKYRWSTAAKSLLDAYRSLTGE